MAAKRRGLKTPDCEVSWPDKNVSTALRLFRALLVFHSKMLVPAVWWISQFLLSSFWSVAKATSEGSGMGELGRRLVQSVAKDSSEAGATKVSRASASQAHPGAQTRAKLN